MKTILKVQNIKCQGCVNTIESNISALNGVTGVTVNRETSEVTILYAGDEDRKEEFAQVLKSIGYPVADEN